MKIFIRSIAVIIVSITMTSCVAYSPARYGGYGYSAPVAMYGGGGWRNEGREHDGWGHEGRERGGWGNGEYRR